MKTAVLTIGAALLWPALAQAQVNHNYLQVGYAVGDLDTDPVVREFMTNTVQESYSGYTAMMSSSPLEHVLFQGEYENLSLEGDQGDIRSVRAGLGGYLPLDLGLGEATDVYATVNYEGFTTYFADGNGVGATLGLRWQASEVTEIEPFVGYMDYGEVESDDGEVQGDLSGWRAGIRATFMVSENLAVSTDWRQAFLTLEQNDAGAEDADIELNEELWFSLRYYWR